MELKSLFAGQEQRHRHREQTCGHSRWDALRVTLRCVHQRVWDRQLPGSNCITRGSQLGALWGPGGVGERFRREGIHVSLQLIQVTANSNRQPCKAMILPLNINVKQQQQKATEVLAGRAVLGRCSRFPGRGIWHPSCTVPGIQQKSTDEWYMYMYGWVPLLLTWNYHNIVNWLYHQYKTVSKKWHMKTTDVLD